MPTVFTPNYNFTEPNVGGDSDIWGGQLNANWVSIDTILKGVDDTSVANTADITTLFGDLGILDGRVGVAETDIVALKAVTITAGVALLGGGDLTANMTIDADVGTGPNQLVQLDVDSKLPAVDGSQLTNIPFPVPQVAVFRDEKPQGTAGGGSNSTGWQKRTINTEQFNSIVGASLDIPSDTITLPAGTYLIDASSPFAKSFGTAIRLFDGTNPVLTGQGVNIHTDNWNHYYALLSGVIVLPALATLTLEYNVNTAKASDGLGLATNKQTEVYSSITITKIA